MCLDADVIKGKLDIVDVIEGSGIALTKVGNEYRGATTSSSKSGMSLCVNRDRQVYDDKSGIAGSGDVFNFIAYQNCLDYQRDFREVLKIGAELAGIQHEESGFVDASKKHELQTFFMLAAEYYHDCLTNDIRELIKSTWGISDKTIDDLRIGYAPANRHLTNVPEIKDYVTAGVMKESGLFWSSGADIFRDRIIFPYWQHGKIVYFIGRDRDWNRDKKNPQGKPVPKFIKQLVHSDKNTHVSKCVQNVLFGLDSTKGHDIVYVTEGIADAIVLIQAGLPVISPVTTRIKKSDIDNVIHVSKNKKVVKIINDNEINNSGLNGAIDTAKALEANGIKAEIIQLPKEDNVDKIDVAEFMLCHSKEDIEKLRGLRVWDVLLNTVAPVEKIPTAAIEKRELAKEIVLQLDFMPDELRRTFVLDELAGIRGRLKMKYADIKGVYDEVTKTEYKGMQEHSDLVKITDSGRVVLSIENVADQIRKEFNILSYSGNLYTYSDGYYHDGSEEIKTRIVQIVRDNGANVNIRETTLDILHFLTYHAPEKEYPFNNGLGYVPFKNGVVKLHFQERRIELLEHSPDYKFNYIIPHVFNPANNGDVIHREMICKYVAEEDQDILYQIPAQALLQAQGMAPYKKGYLLQGLPHGGKSTYLYLLEVLFGVSFIAHRSLQALAENRFAIAGLENKLLNCYDDLGTVPLNDVGVFKTLTGKDLHDIEKKGKEAYSARLFAVHVFTCNAPPTYPAAVKKDPAFWERWEYIRFPHQFATDPKFYDRMFTEENVSGFLHRVLKMVMDIYAEGLKRNSTAEEVREMWSYNADPVYRYLEEFVDKSATRSHYVDKDDLLDKIKRWVISEGQDIENVPTTTKGLTARLEMFDVISVRKTPVDGNRRELYQLPGTLTEHNTSSIYRPDKVDVRTTQGSLN
jgi:hypothetical protein